MCGYPVKYHAYARLVHRVYKVLKLVGSSVSRGGREVGRHLISPRALKGILGQGHHLNMRISHLLDVRSKLASKLGVAEGRAVIVSLPRAHVKLVYIHRQAVEFARVFLAVCKPAAVSPFVFRVCRYYRRRLGRKSCLGSVRICLEMHLSAAVDLVFIPVSRAYPVISERDLPDTTLADSLKRSILAPIIDIAREEDSVGVRRPDSEYVSAVCLMRAEIFIGSVVSSLMEQILSHIVHLFH